MRSGPLRVQCSLYLRKILGEPSSTVFQKESIFGGSVDADAVYDVSGIRPTDLYRGKIVVEVDPFSITQNDVRRDNRLSRRSGHCRVYIYSRRLLNAFRRCRSKMLA